MSTTIFCLNPFYYYCVQVHVATFTEASMMSAEEDSTSSPDDDPYDDTDILNSAGTDEVTAHLAAAGASRHHPEGRNWVFGGSTSLGVGFFDEKHLRNLK